MSNASKLQQISRLCTESDLLNVLKTELNSDDVTLTDIELSEGSGKGDNFLAGVYRLVINGKRSNGDAVSQSIIAKCLPPNIGRRKTFKSAEFFANEVAFYGTVVPKFMEFQEKRKVRNPYTTFPKCYKALTDGENDFMILEDLCVDGYTVLDKKKGADYAHCELALKELARFHAFSLAMKDQDPESFKEIANSLSETYYHEGNREWYRGMLGVFCNIALDAVSTIYPDSIYVKTFKEFSVGLYDRMMNWVLPKEPFSVISHGDAWMPNFMFKYNEKGDLHGAKVLDFQLARYSSPILDIMFFVCSCTTKTLRDSKLQDLLRAYHTSLVDFLNDLGSSPDLFTYEMFEKQLKEYGAYGLGMCIESLPFTLCDSDDAPNIDLIEGDNAVPLTDIWMPKPLTAEEDKRRIADVVKYIVDGGYL